jgi:hypothetical protein
MREPPYYWEVNSFVGLPLPRILTSIVVGRRPLRDHDPIVLDVACFSTAGNLQHPVPPSGSSKMQMARCRALVTLGFVMGSMSSMAALVWDASLSMFMASCDG